MDMLGHGLLGPLSPMWYVVIILFLTQQEIMAITLYFHRELSHGSIRLHPVVRDWLRTVNWLSSSMVTKVWAAIHIAHHEYVETDLDPHSPLYKRMVFPLGVIYYVEASLDDDLVECFAPTKRLPNDRLERHLYGKHPFLGMPILWAALVALLGIKAGSIVWLIQVLWIPFWAAGVINGLGHQVGYRNADTPDTSRNLTPFAVFIGGEELHNNHHLTPHSPKFSLRPWEFDIGWGVLVVLRAFGLVQISPKVGRLPNEVSAANEVTVGSAEAFWKYRYLVMKRFVRAARGHLRDRAREIKNDRRARFVLLRDRLKNGGWFLPDVAPNDDPEISHIQRLRNRLADLCTSKGRAISLEEVRDLLLTIDRRGDRRFKEFVRWANSLRVSLVR